jgi:pyrroline-5-carboxylate reductase
MASLAFEGTLLLVGSGKMGSAMLAGWVAKGLDPARVVVQDPSPPADVVADLRRYGITPVANASGMADPPAVIVMAVKPQVMDQVFPPLAAIAGPQTLILSIAAGRTLTSFERHLQPGAPVVRAMPNTPAAIGRGITVCCPNAHVTPAQRNLCDALLSAVGEVGWVEQEALIDAVTAVSGSGPAYVFLLAECLAAAGIAAGLDSSLARRLADATVSGSGELLRISGTDPAILRQNVTSPGGTTAAALSVLMGPDGMAPLLNKAVEAALVRARELAGN